MSFITISVFEFHHNLSYYFFLHFDFLSFHHNLRFLISSRFDFLSLITIWVFTFITIWAFECRLFKSRFEFLSFITILCFYYHQNWSFWVSTQFEYFKFITTWAFEFYNNLSFWVSSQFDLLSFITIWVFKFHPNLSFWVSSQNIFFLWKQFVLMIFFALRRSISYFSDINNLLKFFDDFGHLFFFHFLKKSQMLFKFPMKDFKINVLLLFISWKMPYFKSKVKNTPFIYIFMVLNEKKNNCLMFL